MLLKMCVAYLEKGRIYLHSVLKVSSYLAQYQMLKIAQGALHFTS